MIRVLLIARSTAITVNAAGSKTGELRYKAFGETRYSSGTTPTTYHSTGQPTPGDESPG